MSRKKSKQFHKIKAICLEKRISGMKILAIKEYLLDEMGVDWSYDKIKNCTRVSRNPQVKNAHVKCESRKVENKKGKTERKPPYEKTDGGYVIVYGDNKKLKVTDDEVDKAFKLYCVAGLTMNATALELNLTRGEFFALKTSFGITKDSVPFTPERIDSMTSDEIAEEIRIAKKRYALKKLEKSKYVDIEMEVKKFNQKNYFFDRALEKISSINPKPFKPIKLKRQDEKYILAMGDCHSGIKSDNLVNVYNFDVMEYRFREIASQIVELLDPCELIIFDGGDKISGLCKGSLIQSSENPIDSIFKITECYTNLFLTLISRGFKIQFASVSGNHDAIFPNKTDRTDESSFSRIVDWALEIQFQQFTQVSFIKSIDNMALMKVFDNAVLGLHGDKSRKLSRYERFFRQENVIEIIGAHYHSYSASNEDNVPVFRINSFCGGDAYSVGLGLNSEPGVRLITYNKIGRVCDRLLRFTK